MSVNKITFDVPNIENTYSVDNEYKLVIEDTYNNNNEIEFKKSKEFFISGGSTYNLTIENESNIFSVLIPKVREITVPGDTQDEERLFIAQVFIPKYSCVSVTTGFNVALTDITSYNTTIPRYVGIAMNEADIGENVTVKITGIIFDTSWGFDTGKELWCDASSYITQTPVYNSGEVSLKVADVLTENLIVVSRYEPIYL